MIKQVRIPTNPYTGYYIKESLNSLNEHLLKILSTETDEMTRPLKTSGRVKRKSFEERRTYYKEGRWEGRMRGRVPIKSGQQEFT